MLKFISRNKLAISNTLMGAALGCGIAALETDRFGIAVMCIAITIATSTVSRAIATERLIARITDDNDVTHQQLKNDPIINAVLNTGAI